MKVLITLSSNLTFIILTSRDTSPLTVTIDRWKVLFFPFSFSFFPSLRYKITITRFGHCIKISLEKKYNSFEPWFFYWWNSNNLDYWKKQEGIQCVISARRAKFVLIKAQKILRGVKPRGGRRKIARLIVKGEGNRLRLVFSRLIEGCSVNSQPGPSKGSQAFFILVESLGWVDGILANPRAPVQIGHPHERFSARRWIFYELIPTRDGYPAMRPGHVAGLRRLRSQWIKEIPWFECHVIFFFLEIYFDRLLIKIRK